MRPCLADKTSLLPLVPVNQEPDWILGPVTNINIGALATIDIPEGYRFADAQGARLLLQQMKDPVPRGLVGLLAPDSRKWMVVLEFADVGYVKGAADAQRLDSTTLLNTVRDRLQSQNENRLKMGLAPVTSMEWQIEPNYDPSQGTLEWAWLIRTGVQLEGVVNHTVRLLGRHGVLDATAVEVPRAGAGSDLIPLKNLMQNVSFKPGERYADYIPGDKLAKGGLAQLVVGEEPEGATISRSTTWEQARIWLCALGVSGLIVGGGLAVRMKLKRGKATNASLGNGHIAANGVALRGNGSNGNGDPRRRKTFNYAKFYSDMMLQVSPHPAFPDGAGNGHSNPSAGNGSRSLDDSIVKQAIVRANLDLIASQTTLIEEQRRLLQEQSKLIEEKTKLIREKNQLLDKQAELFERDIL